MSVSWYWFMVIHFIVFQQTECLIRASMTLLKVPFIFPKHFFSSQQATFIKVCTQEFSMDLLHWVLDCLYSGSSRNAEKVPVPGAGRLRECKNTEFAWELRKTGFCEGGLDQSCPLTRVSVRRASSVYSLDVVGFIKVVEFCFLVAVFIIWLFWTNLALFDVVVFGSRHNF